MRTYLALNKVSSLALTIFWNEVMKACTQGNIRVCQPKSHGKSSLKQYAYTEKLK